VVLFCPGKDDMMSVYHEVVDFFNRFFTEIRAWSPAEDIVYERGVWLRIYGVPLHVWHIKFFEFITSSFGRLLKIDPCTSNLERLDFARFLVSTELFDAINMVDNILIDEKCYNIKIVEEIESSSARDVCFDEEPADSASEFSEQIGDLDGVEPIVDALVQDLKDVWELPAKKDSSVEVKPDDNSHVSASFDVQNQADFSATDPVQAAAIKGQSAPPCDQPSHASNCASSKLITAKAASCSNSRKPSISGPWSFEWIKDHHLGDVGVIFSHKKKNKKPKDHTQQHKGVANTHVHNPSLVSLRRVARMSLKDRQALICMLKKHKKKPAAQSCTTSSENKESLDAKSSSTTSDDDWKNWVSLHDKNNGGSKDIVDIGKAIKLQFKGDCSNMFQVLSRPSNFEKKVTKGDVGVESSHTNFVATSVGC